MQMLICFQQVKDVEYLYLSTAFLWFLKGCSYHKMLNAHYTVLQLLISLIKHVNIKIFIKDFCCLGAAVCSAELAGHYNMYIFIDLHRL